MGRGSTVAANRQTRRRQPTPALTGAEPGAVLRPAPSHDPTFAQRRYGLPGATYRLQLRPGFGFREVQHLVPYLAELGITHVYLSPIFAAAPGSAHGYDVFDHGKVSQELGGRSGLYELGETLLRHQIGLVLDIVPNHVGVAGGTNPWWRSVLRYGEASPFAPYFDIEWRAQPQLPSGILIVPVLGQAFGRALEAGELRLALQDQEIVVRYFDQSFPLRPESYGRVLGFPPTELRERLYDPASAAALVATVEDLSGADYERCETALPRLSQLLTTEPELAAWAEAAVERLNGTPGNPASFDMLDELLSGQHYRLADWRVAGAEVNYRRFFDQNSLAGIRVERESVFAETHRLLFDLVERGIVTGVRVDHVDGLYAPGEYLRRLSSGLREAANSAGERAVPIFVEKILEGDEQLPGGWDVSGTTGYEFMAHADRLFIDPAGARETTATFEQFAGPSRFETVRYESKRQVARSAFAGEISVLAYQLHRLALRSRLHRDNTLRSLRDAIETTLACFPVYRTYSGPDERPASDANYIDAAIADASRRNQNVSDDALQFMREVLLLSDDGLGDEERELRAHFRRRFQQISPPVMAKGLEDTAFFRFSRLLSLNEVGADPGAFGIEPAKLHAWFEARAREWPGAMNASSTHDTKRSEDVRSRLSVLSEIPREWRREALAWKRLNERHLERMAGERAPSLNLEYYLYQTLVGSWPASGLDRSYRERLRSHLIKAAREGKLRTNWDRPDADYEGACLAFLDRILDRRASAAFLRHVQAFINRIGPAARLNSLSGLVLKCMAPGFPDFYQGSELIEFSLTDPDNRREVDFEHRRRLLNLRAAFQPDGCALDPGNEETKLRLTRKLLEIRSRYRELLTNAQYVPLHARGHRSGSVFAFARGSRLVVAIPRLYARVMGPDGSLGQEGWGDTELELPSGRWSNVLGDTRPIQGRLILASLPDRLPIAVLERA